MIPASESVKLLTSSLKGMKLSANEAISVVDKLTKLDMKSATSAQELAQALSKVANSARLAKVSQDEILGILSVGIETTQQSGDVIGTAVRSLLARFSNVKASKFGGSGEETEGTLNDTEAVLSKIGIRIRNASGEMRSFMDVLDDVAEKWDTLDDVSRNAISTAMAGTRQKEIFASIIENYDRVKELIGESANAAGTADEKYSAYMDSMEAATKRLQNAWEGFTQSLETSTVMKFLTNSVALLVENADKLKYIVTGIAAASSARIFDFFTNKGETGGWKGLIANIPFIGRGTKTNNILESIDKKVGDIRGEVKKDKNGATKNGSIISRLMSGRKQYKADEAFVKSYKARQSAYSLYTENQKVVRGYTKAKQIKDLSIIKQAQHYRKFISDYESGKIDTSNMSPQEERAYEAYYKQAQSGVKGVDSALSRQSALAYVKEARNKRKLNEKFLADNKKQYKEAQKRIAAQKALSLDTFKQTAAVSGIATLATQLLTTKEVGAGIGGWAGKLITGNRGNQQTLEETAGDKALRTGFATAGSIGGAAAAFIPVVGPAIAPIVSAIGSVVGEGIGGLLSTWFRADELAMKQRVADAKENLSRLDAIKSTMETNSSIMTEELTSSEDFEKLYKYTDDLYDKLFELQYEGNVDIIGAFNKFAKTVGNKTQIENISDLVDEINNGNADQRSMIKKQLELAEAQINLEELRKSQEEEREKIKETTSSKISSGTISDLNESQISKLKEFGFNYSFGWTSRSKTSHNRQSSKLYFDQDATAEERIEAIDKAIKYLKDFTDNTSESFVSALREQKKEIEKSASSLKKYDQQIFNAKANVGFLAANIHDLTTTELKDLTMDGVVGRVVEALEAQGVEVRNAVGYIKDEYQDAIEKLIKSDSKFSTLQQADTKTLGQLTSAQERFSSMLEEQAELVKEYGESWEKWYDAAKRGKLSEEIAKIVYAANPERTEQFARAWNTTREGLEKLTKEFPDLTTAIGLMSPSEVREYYSVFTDLFEDLAADSALTAENFEKLINQYPQLLKYYKNGTLSTELLSKANEEQRVAYANAMLSAELSNAGIAENFLTAVKSVSMGKANEEAARFINLEKDSAAAILKEIGSVKSLNEVLDKANVLRQKGGEDNEKTANALEKLVEQYLNYEKVIEWTDPIYAMAQQGEIDRLTQEIENLNEQKDALSNVNDERQRELDLIKAKEALENARKEKKRVYRAGLGFVMESDEEAIATAQENLDKLNVEKQQEDIQYQIEQLESLKSILENLDEEKQKEANKKALEEYFGGKNPLDLTNSDMVSKLVEGYAENRISINTGTGEIKDADGNVIGNIDGLEGVKKSKNEQASSAKTALIGGKDAEGNDVAGAFNTFNTAKSTFEDIDKSKIGTEEYRTAAEDYRAAKKDLETKLSEAKSTGVDAETIEKGSNLLKSYEEPEKSDWILVNGLKNPDSSLLGNHVASGTHDVMLTTKETADTNQFNKSKYTVVKTYNPSTGEWGGWEKISGSISGLPDNSIVMNSDWDDAYAWVKGGQLYWVADANGNIKKDGTWHKKNWATGTTSAPEGLSLINELGTEAVITPGGTLTALPSKTGIVPADITRNVWALGEVAPTLVAQLGSLTQKTLSGNAGNTTYEEGQYFDNFTMNVYPAKGDDFNKILEQARAQMRLTRHNN